MTRFYTLKYQNPRTMKKIITTAFLASMITLTFSQKVEGVITYVESIDMTDKIKEMNANMDSAKKANPERAAMMGGLTKQIEEFMRSFEKTSTTLAIKDSATLYKEKPAELTESEVNQESNFMMAYKPKSDIIYYNKKKNQSFTQKNFMGKDFLIKDTLRDYKWKIVMEQKVISGYPCMKAVREDSMYTIEAWFTSQIPISSGPKGLYGLPGLILEAKLIKKKDENETLKPKKGSRRMMQEYMMDIVIKAEVIEMKEVSKKEIKAPNKGKVLSSEEEYVEMVTKKVEEMQKNGGRGGFRMKM